MKININVHGVDEDSLTDVQVHELSEIVDRFFENDVGVSSSGVEVSVSDDEKVSVEPDVEIDNDRIPDEWNVREGKHPKKRS